MAKSRTKVRMEWGLEAVERAGNVVVVVDVLSFCTTVATATSRNCTVRTSVWGETPPAGFVVAARRGTPNCVSLSPLSFLAAEPGLDVVLPSPNGSTCTSMLAHVPHVFAGALVNASAVARAAAEIGDEVTIISCGEQGRFALEDHLGAAAIAAAIEGETMPGRDWYRTALRGCLSGIELIDLGFGADVDHAASLDLLDVAPRLENGAYRSSVRF